MEKKISRLTVLIISVAILAGIDLFGQCTPYLGQIPPTIIVKRFPPSAYLANATWKWHGSPVFSSDGEEMFWVKYYNDDSGTEIWFTKCVNGQWAAPQKASFSIKSTAYFDNNPVFSVTNDTLYFQSRREGSFIHYVVRTATEWSTPQPLNIPLPQHKSAGLQFSMTKDKTIYFELQDDTSTTFSMDIYRTKLINGQYTQPENIGAPVNTEIGELVGYIDPEERFLLYCSKKEGGYGYHDIYLSKRNADGSWNTPVILGTKINGSFEDVAPYITPDGLYFFYTTWKNNDLGYNPYWVSAQFIYDMVTDIKDETSLPNEFNLKQNYPNPFNPSTAISYQIPVVAQVTLKIYDAQGNEITTLVNAIKESGSHSVIWNGTNNTGHKVSSGIYFYSLISGKERITSKAILLK